MTTDLALVREFAPIRIKASQDLLDRVADDLAMVPDLAVDSQDMADEALVIVGRLSTVKDELDKERLELTKPLRDGQAWVNGGYAPTLDTLDTAIKTLKLRLTEWQRKVREANELLRRQAEQRQREDAARVASEAEAKRKEAERLAAEAAKVDGPAQADLLSQAQVAADQAQQTALAAEVAQVAPVAVATVAGVKGVAEMWKGECKNLMLLVAHIAKLAGTEGRATEAIDLLSLIKPDQTALDARARAQKGNMRIPGCVSYPVELVRTRKVAV